MTPKEKADEIIDKFLCIDDDSSLDLFCPECGMSVDAAKKCAIIAVENEFTALREQIFNMRACHIIESEKTYLHRLDRLIAKEKEIKKEIENYE